MRPLLQICFLLVLSRLITYAQGENNIWITNHGFGFDCNYDPPRLFEPRQRLSSDAVASISDAVASISDADGKLLYCTDGKTVWDSSYQVVPNGDGLKGHHSAHKGSLFVPLPGSDDIVLFTMSHNFFRANAPLHYSIINKKTGVYPDKKNIYLSEDNREGLCAAKGSCGRVWVLHAKKGANEIWAIPVDENGVGQAVISKVVHFFSDEALGGLSKLSTLLFDPITHRIVLINRSGSVEMFDFDVTTGLLSNPSVLRRPAKEDTLFTIGYGGVLSNDGRFLFVNETTCTVIDPCIYIYTYDLMATDIVASRKKIGELETSIFGGMQAHPLSGDIYMADTRFIDGNIEQSNRQVYVIERLNDTTYVPRLSDITLPRTASFGHFTNTVVVSEPIPEVGLFSDTIICDSDETAIYSTTLGSNWSKQWNTGAIDDTLYVSQNGTFKLTASDSLGCIISDSVEVVFAEAQVVSIIGDTILCPDEIITLSTEESAASYMWSTNATTREIMISESGVYSVKVTDSDGCTAVDQIVVTDKANCDCNIYIPNALSISSANDNNNWRAVSNCAFSSYELTVYDRWGGEIYRTTNPADAWSGAISSKLATSGVYAYLLRYQFNTNEPMSTLAGDLTVVR